MTQTFSTLGVRPELVQSLNKAGLLHPTPIQERAIPSLLKGQDVIAQAQTGTGKTLAFVLPILERIDVQNPAVQALIITPTRELALQITDEVRKLASAVGVKVLAAYGGQDVEGQIHKLRGAIHLVIGTPGRLLDHLRRGTVDFQDLSMLVLDEADQMLHMGFLREVEQIIEQTAQERQTMLFSATMPPEIRSVAARYMSHPVEIRVQSPRITLDEIEQLVIETSDRFKQDALIKMIDQYNPYLAIIFCRTKRRASALNEALLAHGYESDELHGDLSQAKREKVMKRFRDAKIQLLVATDVAARGLDVEGVTHVFNYDIPQDVESYIHRIGRTGRAGERGLAVTFVAPKDREFLRLIEAGIKRMLPKRTANGQKLPDRREGEDAGHKPPRNAQQGGRHMSGGKYPQADRFKKGGGGPRSGGGTRNGGGSRSGGAPTAANEQRSRGQKASTTMQNRGRNERDERNNRNHRNDRNDRFERTDQQQRNDRYQRPTETGGRGGRGDRSRPVAKSAPSGGRRGRGR